MSYHGDIRLGESIDVKFCTVSTTGAPTTLAGTPAVSAYVGNSVTQLTAGITLTVDFDAVTGLHNVRVVATSGNGYVTASNYQLVITTGTVGGTSVVGYVVGEFSIEARSAVMPTVAARTLDVTATGGAGIDWANVEAPTTSLALTGTTIATTQKVDVETIKTNPVVNTGTITFPTTATLASTTNITAGTITTTTNLTTNNDKTGYSLTATTGLGNQTANLTGNLSGSVGSVTGAVGSVTGLTAANLDATISSRATPAQVNTEVLDVLNTDTFAEPPQELPPATTTLVKKIGYLFKAWRNKSDQTATLYRLYNDDAVTVDQKATVGDDGTTYTSGEKATGP